MVEALAKRLGSGRLRERSYKFSVDCALCPRCMNLRHARVSPFVPKMQATALERRIGLRYGLPGMLDMTLGCLKWAAVGFVVAFALMKLFEASQIHEDIPKPAFKIRQTKRVTLVLSTFAAMLSALVWLLVQKLD